jgi:hypothetical protein
MGELREPIERIRIDPFGTKEIVTLASGFVEIVAEDAFLHELQEGKQGLLVSL